MSDLTEFHLAPAVAEALGALGYSAADSAVRDQCATAARGHNLVLAWPPAACYSAPALAGLVTAVAAEPAAALVLAPAHTLAEWAATLLPLARAAGVSAFAAETPGRAIRRLREPGPHILLTTPANAQALQQRSALKVEQLRHVVLAWPELFQSDDALAALMQDLPAEAQRVLVLADPAPGHPLVERYARRGFLTGPLAPAPEAPRPERPAVRVVSVGWARRGEALAGLLEQEDPASGVVWCADRAGAAAASAALPAGDDSLQVVTGDPPAAALIVAWDLPEPARLAALRGAGDLVLLVPPHGAGYVRRVSSRRTPVRVAGALEAAREVTAGRRRRIQAALESGGLDGELLALAPLFERFDPAGVAAAVYRLWVSVPEREAEEPAPVQAGPAVRRIWVGAGRKDGATPADLVAVLTREVGVAAARIGKIEIREVYSLVEVPGPEAEDIARRLSGKSVRRRTLTARVDRGRVSAG